MTSLDYWPVGPATYLLRNASKQYAVIWAWTLTPFCNTLEELAEGALLEQCRRALATEPQQGEVVNENEGPVVRPIEE